MTDGGRWFFRQKKVFEKKISSDFPKAINDNGYVPLVWYIVRDFEFRSRNQKVWACFFYLFYPNLSTFSYIGEKCERKNKIVSRFYLNGAASIVKHCFI